MAFENKCRVCGEYMNKGNKYGICTVAKECRDAREAIRSELLEVVSHMKRVINHFIIPDEWYGLNTTDRAIFIREIKGPWETNG